jgi:cell wall assembly regulator SMI1
MDLNEVVSTTKQWKLVANKLELDERVKENKLAREALISPTGSSLSLDKNRSTLSLNETTKGYGKLTTDENSIDPDLERKISGSHERVIRAPHAPKQRSIPPGAVKPLFANSSWIPLITDDSGNHIGVDLDPDQQGSLGQVILFGREFDTKFVLAPNWGDFLLSFVKELENGNYLIHSEVDDVFAGEGELVFFDKAINREVQYLSYLTHRVLAYWRSQNPQPKRQQPQQQQQQQQQQQGSSSSSQQQAPVEKKTLVPHIAKNEERIISHDITSTNDEDTKQDVKLLDTGDKDSDDEAKEPVKTETKLVDTDAGADAEEDVPNKSQDITEASLSNDFKDVSI